MSLDWRLNDIPNYKTLCWLATGKDDEVTLNPITEVLIYKTMVVDMGNITPKLIDEFAYRVMTWEAIFGGSIINTMSNPFVERGLTYEEIAAHVGLRTNVINTTRAAWHKRLIQMIDREFSWKLKKAKEVEAIPV